MALNRSDIYDALFARLKGCADWRSSWRETRSFDTIPQPALIVEEGDQIPIDQHPRPPAWKLEADLMVCVHPSQTPDQNSSPLQPFLDAIEKALEAQDGEHGNRWHTSLGGLCEYARIAGPIGLYHGDTANQAVAVLHLEILAPVLKAGSI